MNHSSAGLFAGFIVGFVTLALWFSIFFLAFAGRLTPQGMVSGLSETSLARNLGMSGEVVTFFLMFGFIFGSVVLGGLGAILGVLFVKLTGRIQSCSIRLEALAFGCAISVVVTLGRLAVMRPPDIFLLITLIVDSQIFAVLYAFFRRP